MFLKEQRVTTADTYGALLEREVPMLADAPIYRLVHDDLSEHWHPVWFAEFAEHAARHGLGYVGEADLFSLRTEMLPEGVEPEVWTLAGGDRIAFENYSDLLTARHFRQSILCRARRGAAARARAGRAPSACTGPCARRPSRSRSGWWPTRSPSSTVAARRRSASPNCATRSDADPGALAEALIDGFRRERLIPHAGPLRAATDPGERPVASPLARWQARAGPDLTSLAYQTVRMEEPAAAAADHAARRHARPRRDPSPRCRSARGSSSARRTSTPTSSSSLACSCLSRPTRTPDAARPRSIPHREKLGLVPGQRRDLGLMCSGFWCDTLRRR